MAKVDFGKKKAISEGFQIFKKHFKFILGVYLISFAISIGRIFFNFPTGNSQLIELSFVVNFVLGVLSIIVSIGTVKVWLNVVDNKTLKFSDLFKEYPLFFSFLLASIVNCILVIIGFVALIIPGIFFALRYQYFLFVMVEKKTGAMESLYLSEKVTRGNLKNLFLFNLLILGVNILGLLCLGVGLLLTIPVTTLANVWVYRQLAKSNL